MNSANKAIGRNEKCPCNSGRKYKRCCLGKEPVLPGSPSVSSAHSRKRLTSGFLLPELQVLKKFQFNDIQNSFLPHHKVSVVLKLMRQFVKLNNQSNSPMNYVFSRLASGELDLALSYPQAMTSVLAQVQLQEKLPEDEFVANCSCVEGRSGHVCDHLHASIYFLWSLIHQESPLYEDLGSLQTDFDRILNRQAKLDPDSGIAWIGISFCPPGAQGLSFSDSNPNHLVSQQPMKSTHIQLIKKAEVKYAAHIEFSHPSNAGDGVRVVKGFFKASQEIQRRSFYKSTLPSSENLTIYHSLEYHFSNGCSLTVGELLESRWLKKVPSQFLPLEVINEGKENLLPIWAKLKLGSLESFVPHSESIAQTAILHCLSRALSASVQVTLVSSSNSKHERMGLRLRSLRAETPSSSAWRLLLNPRPNEADLEFMDDADTCWKQVDDEFILLSGPFAASLGLDYFSQSSIHGQEEIQAAVDTLDRSLKLAGLPPVEVPWADPLSEVQTRPEIWLDGKGGLSFSHHLSALHFRLWNIPQQKNSLFQVLENGITSFSALDSKEIASQRQGSQREADLKILRHTGFAAALTLEVLSYGLHQTSSTGVPFTDKKTFHSWLNQHLSSLAEKISAMDRPTDPSSTLAPSLSDLLSKRVMTLIQELISALFLSLEKPRPIATFLPEKAVQIDNLEKNLAYLVHSMILQAAVHSKGACFLKARIPAGFSEPEAQSFWRAPGFIEPEIIGVNQIPAERGKGCSVLAFAQAKVQPILSLHAALALVPFGFQIFWEGQPISELQPQDLQTLFDLQTSAQTQNTKGTLDWFELHPRVFLMGKEISQSELAQLATEGTVMHRGQLYVIPQSHLPSLRRLSSFWERLQQPSGKNENWRERDHYHALPRSETLEFLALSEELGAKISGASPEWKQVYEFYQSLDQPRPPLVLPRSILAELKPYQNAGVQWLWELHQLKLGGILADDMGLGKTLQALSFLEFLRDQDKLGNSLVVVPTSLTWNWISEAKRFTPDLPIRTFESKNKAALDATQDLGVLVVTYGLLMEHSEWFTGEPNQPRQWNIVFFDEAQNLKNLTSRRTDTARKIVADYKFAITGTPLENHVGELYSLLDLVVPGCVGDPSVFKNRFDQWADPKNFQLEFTFLRKKIRPLLLRRTKAQILTELPEKTETRVNLPLETKQKIIYRDIALSYSKQVNDSILKVGEAKSQLMMLTALLRLRQACSDPSCLPNVRYSKISPKLELIAESLPEILESGHSVLIFTQFLTTLERWAQHLKKLKIPTLTIHGGVSRKDREKILAEFQKETEGSGRVLMMTLKTGGVGLNLTQASYVFHVEPWWNPAVENQATDRAHRMGQTRSVQVYRYVMQDTVEEKIETLKLKKSVLFNAVLNDSIPELPDAKSFDDASETEDTQTKHRALSRKDFALLLNTSAG